MWTVLGLELDNDASKTVVIITALCSLKSAGATFMSHLASCMQFMDHLPFWTDPDLWMRPEIHPEDRVQYLSCLLCYFDDILCIYHYSDIVLLCLHRSFLLKLGYGN